MAQVFEIDPEINLGVTVVFGHVTGRELHDRFRSKLDHPHWHPELRLLADYRWARVFDFTPEDLDRMEDLRQHALHEGRIGETRFAFLVGSDAQETIIRIREFHSRRSSHQMRAFHDVVAAIEWLGVEAEAAQRLLDSQIARMREAVRRGESGDARKASPPGENEEG